MKKAGYITIRSGRDFLQEERARKVRRVRAERRLSKSIGLLTRSN